MNAKALVCVLIFLVTSFVWSKPRRGGWVSSGGEIFLYDRNPWFVKNTTNVRFCILVDEGSVSVGPDFVREQFIAALDFWRREMRASNRQETPGMVDLATQVFDEVSCKDSHDLALKVGYGTLSAEEIQFLTRPEEDGAPQKEVEAYIGVTIRKSYDFAQLRAQGTVFIASDRGPHAYRNQGQLISEAWSRPRLLQYAMMHELGHVFGVPHTGTGLMSEIFLEQILNQRMASFFSSKPVQGFLLPPKEFEVCTLSGSFRPQFFKITTAIECLVLQEEPNAGGKEQTWRVGARDSAQSAVRWVGTLHINSQISSVASLSPSVTMQLPPEQTVFSAKEIGFASFLLGGVFVDLSYQGAYRVQGSMRPYPVFATFSQNRIQIFAAEDGKILQVLDYSPPTFMRMLTGF